MAHVRTAGAFAVKLDCIVDGHSAQLTIDGTQLRYERDGASPIEREFSVTTLDPGAYSVLIEGRSYRVIAASGGQVSVNGRRFSVELFDPRELGVRKSTGGGMGRQNIVAMMPGKIIRVIVAVGD